MCYDIENEIYFQASDCCNIGFYITSTKLFIIVTSAVTSHYNNVRCKNICLEREKTKKMK